MLKRLSAIIMILVLLFSGMPITTSASGTMYTDLKEGLVTKSDRLTFDLWAKDANGEKIDGSLVEVLNNGVAVPINWDDKEKTSYTVQLGLGENKISIKAGQNSLHYTITREFANDGDEIGQFTFSLDAFTIGLGYIIEPIEVPIIKGENSAQQLDRILNEYGFNYKSTGSLTSGFYLASIQKEDLFSKAINIPQSLKDKLGTNYNEGDFSVDTGLGEFDINHMSGWMYSVNNTFPNVGFADKYMIDGDVMRVQFTLAYGQDIGGEAMGESLGQDYFPKVNRDVLTKQLAYIHGIGKEKYLINSARIQAYKNALKTMATFNISQSVIDQSLTQLQAADAITASDGSMYEEENQEPFTPPVTVPDSEREGRLAANRVISQINVLPFVEDITLQDSNAIQAARTAYNRLSPQAQGYVSNILKLVSLEQQITLLQQLPSITIPTEPPTVVEKVIAQIQSLPSTTTKNDIEKIVAARKAYEALTDEQKLEVVNYSYLLLVELSYKQLLEQAEISTAKIANVTTIIGNLPVTITIADEQLVEHARKEYSALSIDEKNQVKNYEKLVQAQNTIEKLIKQFKDEVLSIQKFISQLPKDLQQNDKSLVDKLYASYEKLTSGQKELVENRDVLLKARAFFYPENDISIINETAILQDNSTDNTISLNVQKLQHVFDNKDVSSIVIKRADGMKLTFSKDTIQPFVEQQGVDIVFNIVTIGEQKQLTISINAENPVSMPIKLELPVANWSNGYLLKETENGFAATPHVQLGDYLVATVENGQVYTYTTKTVEFKDVKTNIDDITYLANRHVIQGVNGLFKPNDSISRAQFAVMIARAMGAKASLPTKLTDIKGKWYEENVQALSELGIITGSNGVFKPNDKLSRQHAAIMMARILRQAGVEQPSTFELNFKDSAAIPQAYAADIAWLQQLGIMSGANNTFSPKSSLTRAQMAKILRNTLNVAKIM